MKRGDVILLEEMDEEFQDGWWLGEHPGTGQKGLFPAGMRIGRYPIEISQSTEQMGQKIAVGKKK